MPNERELTDSIAAAARRLGWWCSHDPDSRRQEAGEPDLLLLWTGGADCPYPHRLLFVELKVGTGRETADQRAFRTWATMASVPCYLLVLPDDADRLADLTGVRLAGEAEPAARPPAQERADLLRRAVAAGLDAADLERYPTATLRRVVEAREREMV